MVEELILSREIYILILVGGTETFDVELYNQLGILASSQGIPSTSFRSSKSIFR
jgi:hypothetical protein